VSTKVAEKLSETPTEEIVEPKPHVAGPALEALRWTGHEDSLRDLYANLLAASMDMKTASMAHPSFVEIIKQLTPDEARLMKYFSTENLFPIIHVRAQSEDGSGYQDILVNFSVLGEAAGCENPNLTPSYLDNLARLGLIQMPEVHYTAPNVYDELENHPSIVEARKQIDNLESHKSSVEQRIVRTTQLGQQFIKACVTDHRDLYGASSES